MDDARFERYVREWTNRAAQDLRAAQRAADRSALVALLALPAVMVVCGAAGIAAIIGGLTAIVTATSPILAIVLVLFGGSLATVAWEIARALHVRVPPPDGLSVERHELPALWARVDRIAASVGAEPPDHIVIERGFTAYAGWRSSSALSLRGAGWLGLGLATFAMFEEDELDSIIAHELSHILHGDGRALRRSWRALVMWDRVAYAASFRSWKAAAPDAGMTDRWIASIYRRTIAPIAAAVQPRVAGIERAIAREHELVADAAGVRATSQVAAARALIRCAGRLEIWGAESSAAWNAAMYEGGAPRGQLAVETAQLAAGPLDLDRVRMALGEALMEPDHWSDEHPALSRRLAMLGVGVDRPNQLVVTFEEALEWAARPASGRLWSVTFASPGGERVLGRIAAAWLAEEGTNWKTAQVDARDHRAADRDLGARAAAGDQLRAEDYLRLSVSARFTTGREAARSWLVWATSVDPAHAGAAYALGRSLLAAGDATGLGWLEHAIALGPEFTGDALLAVAGWHRSRGDASLAAATMQLREQRCSELDALVHTPAAAINAAPVEHAPPSPREASIIVEATADLPEVVGAWCGRLRIANPPLGRAPVAVILQLRPNTPPERVGEVQESVSQSLDRAWFGSRFDQWFVMVGLGPCPANTLGGRLEAVDICRVSGVGVQGAGAASGPAA